MVSESVEFAFEDMNARVFEEARMKAEELLPAVETALAGAAAFLDQAEIAKIEECRDRVTRAIEDRDAAPLKAAVEELDRATEGLAAILVEQATAALFSGPQD